MEEERPSGRGGHGKQQRAEDKDLSGPYVSLCERSRGLGWTEMDQTGPWSDPWKLGMLTVENLPMKRHFVLPGFTAECLYVACGPCSCFDNIVPLKAELLVLLRGRAPA